MHLVVTGSSGLIGTAVVGAALVRGDTVTRHVRGGPSGASRPGVTDVAWDPDAGHVDRDALAATGPVDAVVHLAGAGVGDRRWSPDRKRVILESRTRGTDLVARTVAALDPLPRALVSASAVGWYGDRGDDVLDETEPAGHGFLAGVCVAWEAATAPADTKQAWKAMVRSTRSRPITTCARSTEVSSRSGTFSTRSARQNATAASHCPTRLATAEPASSRRGRPSQPYTSSGHSTADVPNPTST